MLEGLVAWILNTYLGKYIELNTDQLSIALLSGKVELENVPLKKEALRHLGFPVDIKTGFIGKIELQIPVRQIRSAPWIIIIEQLCFVASPLSVDQWDSEAEVLSKHEAKLMALNSIEAEWRLEKDLAGYNSSSSYYSSTYSSWYSYGTGLITEIMENLQLKIQNIHVRYEDCTTVPDQKFAFGITLGSLIAQSCDHNWLPKFIHNNDTSEESFKILEIKEFALYWTGINEGECLAGLDLSGLAEEMGKNNLKKYTKNFLLPPVSAQAHLKRNKSSKALRSSTPRYFCDFLLEDVHLSVLDWQYKQLIGCVRGLQDLNRIRNYRRFKPLNPVEKDPKAWWFYAVSCLYPTGEQPSICRPKPTWESCSKRARDIVRYVKICGKVLTAPSVTLSADEKKFKEEIEWAMGYEELKTLRKLAMDSVRLPQWGSTDKARNTLVKWFPSWMGWYGNSGEGRSKEETDLEGEILEVLANSADNVNYRRDVVLGKLHFCLKTGSLTLRRSYGKMADDSTSMLEMEFGNFVLGFLSKPRFDSYAIELSLDSLYLKDKINADTMFPIVIAPSGLERLLSMQVRGQDRKTSMASKQEFIKRHLFYLMYEKRTNNSRLTVKSESLDIVYQPDVIKWFMEFVYQPLYSPAVAPIQTPIKTNTKIELMKNWEHIISAGKVSRSAWELEFDITAPQIIFVEQFSEQNSPMAVVDFGKLHLKSNVRPDRAENTNTNIDISEGKTSEEDETYLTPCSTPPVSEESLSVDQEPVLTEDLLLTNQPTLNEENLHSKLYDTYNLELTDLQILIGRLKDNWRFALNRGSSNLHVIDRFCISVQIERRLFATADPHYPNFILNAHLPKLVTHINELNMLSACNLIEMISKTLIVFKIAANTTIGQSTDEPDAPTSQEPHEDDDDDPVAHLITTQFFIDQMSLEIQSRGRSIAELQIAGVKASLSKRPHHTSLTFTLHSLLLVDALQTFGADFELLMASHRHLGMDSLSGSIRGSEPQSPVSPASPCPGGGGGLSSRSGICGADGATSPTDLTRALNTLATSVTSPMDFLENTEALISIEIQLVTGSTSMQIVNIQFNNLDIIANQETLVELAGFFKRIFPDNRRPLESLMKVQKSAESLLEESMNPRGNTEITFDFHRLNVLLLRGALKDGKLYGRKIGTATITQAKIQATINPNFVLEGSLGSFQILDLTPQGRIHQNILSIGDSPNNSLEHSRLYQDEIEKKPAFSFRTKSRESCRTCIDIRMASVWYTHCPYFILELKSCASEFEVYLTNLAKTIKSFGLATIRTESSTRTHSAPFTPTKKLYYKDSSPYSPSDGNFGIFNADINVEMDSPVIILPKNSLSTEVFVLHLGKITVNNHYPGENTEFYNVEIKDMNIFSLDIEKRTKILEPQILYNCSNEAKPILHDTVLLLKIEREFSHQDYNYPDEKRTIILRINASIITALKVSLTIPQYRQMRQTLDWLSSINYTNQEQDLPAGPYINDVIKDGDVGTLEMDPQIRAKLFLPDILKDNTVHHSIQTELSFDISLFTVELKGSDRTLVNVSLADFAFVYKKHEEFEANLRISLRSLLVEDLQRPINSKYRIIAASSCDKDSSNSHVKVSKSCPVVSYSSYPRRRGSNSSLPDHLEQDRMFGGDSDEAFPHTPPSSPIAGQRRGSGEAYYQRRSPSTSSLWGSDEAYPHPKDSQGERLDFGSSEDYPRKHPRHRPVENLVIISAVLVDPGAPNFQDNYSSSTTVDFNCLDLVLSPESWILLLDFFDYSPEQTPKSFDSSAQARKKDKSLTNINVRSLTIVLVEQDNEIAKANVSDVEIGVKITELAKEIEASLGYLSLQDLTFDGRLYKDRFLTSGSHPVHFEYTRYYKGAKKGHDAELSLRMTSVIYVHTKRFIAEVLAFFQTFSEARTKVLKGFRKQTTQADPLKLLLRIEAKAPVILLPVSSSSLQLIVIDLGQLKASNSFKLAGDDGTLVPQDNRSGSSQDLTRRSLLDVMTVYLEHTDLYMGVKGTEKDSPPKRTKSGCWRFRKIGPSLLREKFELKLRIQRNLDISLARSLPDTSIYGELSTLDIALDSDQYRTIRGLLALNLGEDTERIYPSIPRKNEIENIKDWTLLFIKLDLQNVNISLWKSHEDNSKLACVSLIKSHLTIETFSNFCQDIDLVSKEILIKDIREDANDSGRKRNVFGNILEPIGLAQQVQAEIHTRKRKNFAQTTILFNDIKLMGIFDWWEEFLRFVGQDFENAERKIRKGGPSKPEENPSEYELKLNITDSNVIIVEDSSRCNSNAVILKSTTVLNYKPFGPSKPLTCNLNNCEMFSCILGLEEETALSIIDPVTLNLDINQDGILEVQLQSMTVRLSYHDMCMFMKILNSLPKQLISSKNQDQLDPHENQIAALSSLGFSPEACEIALEVCSQHLDEAALWLTNNKNPDLENKPGDSLQIRAIDIDASCISLCIIDDCGDSDVPLLELALSDLSLEQNFDVVKTSSKGSVNCTLSMDYYNRVLSGWEPMLEPWRCSLEWSRLARKTPQSSRLSIKLDSQENLDANLTSTCLELYEQVKLSWLGDWRDRDKTNAEQYDENEKEEEEIQFSAANLTRRSPFVPFALKNRTGANLRFSTNVCEWNDYDSMLIGGNSEENWTAVKAGETVNFSFTSRDKIRHRNSHKMRMHQLKVKIDGWNCSEPVTVDKVGVYFRDTCAEFKTRTSTLPHARIVFDVTLEGSARKLITIRSALLLVNNLPRAIDVKLENKLPNNDSAANFWVANQFFTVGKNETLPVPLDHAHSLIHIRPFQTPQQFTYSFPGVSWTEMSYGFDRIYRIGTCHSHKGENYRFYTEIVKQGLLTPCRGKLDQPAHTIYILPVIIIENLLPVDLQYSIFEQKGLIKSCSSATIEKVVSENIELKIELENFRALNSIFIPSDCSSGFNCRIKMEDKRKRKLNLSGQVMVNNGAMFKISISAHYWIVNKTGLPLVFRQSGTSMESAGQFDEHEQARMVGPLMFSFSDQGASPTVNARIGNRVIWDGTPQWCANFHVQKGTQYRKLHVTLRDGRPDVVFTVGLEVRQGRGKYRSTNILTISPRYRLYNRTSYNLLVAQRCFAKETRQTPSPRSCLKSVKNSHMAFHWPNLEKEQLLCLSIEDVQDCCWSGGLDINDNNSMHVNIRDSLGGAYFLRMEVTSQGATSVVVFTDADHLPPPLRLDNFSEVSLMFGQACHVDVAHSTARAHSSVPYAWDEPHGEHLVKIIAPGGVSNAYATAALGPAPGLTYENFIYVALTGTFRRSNNNNNRGHYEQEGEHQDLVLDVTKRNRVVTATKVAGGRSQLWRMTPDGYLEHEGSRPPRHPHQARQLGDLLVLDIEDTAPQPGRWSKLALRRADPRRRSTQRWRFTGDGRLRCDHHNMCVQVVDGLRAGNHVVLGLSQSHGDGLKRPADGGPPVEQAMERQYLRPGSGLLTVTIHMDGPTKVISVRDAKNPDSIDQKGDCEDSKEEVLFSVNLEGIGISLVNRRIPEELMYIHFRRIFGEMTATEQIKRICFSIKDIQVDNQLLDTTVPVLAYVTHSNPKAQDPQGHDFLPALDFSSEIQRKSDVSVKIFKHLIVRLKKITLIIEEIALLKLLEFLGFGYAAEESVNKDYFEDNETAGSLTGCYEASNRYYFGIIKLIPGQIRLSVKTATTNLPRNLKAIKRSLGLTLIKFEDAAVELEAFERKHPFETNEFLMKTIIKHFKDELIWQAGIILGSVDFIGNPLGLVNDVSEGITGFITEGSVRSLVKNVTHGMSNSAAKITESLSDGLGKVAMDDYHEEIRQKIRTFHGGKSSDHILAGFKGLGFGILGGATGIFKQVYEGASNDGIQGVFSGLGKGLVGAVTKPVVGVLDFASETARAVRDSSKSKQTPERRRLPRCVHGPGGLLPKYNSKQSQGQEYLYRVNNKNYSEKLIAFEILGSASEDLLCIVSNETLRIVTSTKSPELTSVVECLLSDLEICNVIKEKEHGEIRHYIEIVMRFSGTSATLVNPDPVKKPRVRCRSLDLADSISKQINYAKKNYSDHLQTLIVENSSIVDE
ncbi:unnamed protein product [Phyllotreta striolata]|uniref:UBA domain-containing protein n=1 Tax=Phyllotreta striolata TaxID=444603 RepID=A0A9N9TJA8_PHYSR|nr:unnamed protein product [Phyllotreta striolata]